MPKRKFEECSSSDPLDNDDTPITSETDDNSNCSIQTSSSTDVPTENKGPFNNMKKRAKKSVQFQKVTVYYFPRKQGFTCVPSQGGSTLGMGDKHAYEEDFSLKAYAREQKRIHKQILLEQKQQGKLANVKINMKTKSDSDIDEENMDSDSAESSESELDVDDYFFLQPISTRQRRLLLRSSGIKKIDPIEKEECKDIRVSRESCGCDCRVFCDPETCACSKNGIKCQVDRLSFPCGCSKDGCGNVNGRIEFNPVRVRTHFIHTLMRIELDRKQEQHNTARRLALQQQQKLQPHIRNTSTESNHVNLQQPLDNFTCDTKIHDVNDNPKNEEENDEEEDMSQFNSNERGSCRDCQNTEIADVLMHEAQLGSNNMEVDNCISNNDFVNLHYPKEDQHMSQQHVHTQPLPANQNSSLPRVMLFNDDDDYNAENTTSMYGFKPDESSYSESSECSSEGSEDSHNFRHFQELSSFNSVGQNGTVVENSGMSNGYCIPTHSSFPQPATAQPEQKYIELSSSTSGYKLEPISEILNPIRSYNGYPSGSSTSATSSLNLWSNTAQHYRSSYMENTSAQQPHSDTNDMFASSSINGSCTYSADSSCKQSATSTFMFSSSRHNNANNHHSDTILANLDNVDSSSVSHHKMNNYMSSQPPYQATYTQMTNAATYARKKIMMDGCITSCNGVQSSADSLYSSMTVPDVHNDIVSNPVSRQCVEQCVPDTSDIATSLSGGDSPNDLCAQLSTQDSTDDGESGVADLENDIDSSPDSQNFGEIIKESIVETVSA